MDIQNEASDYEVSQLRDLLFSDYIKKINSFENQISDLKAQIQSVTSVEKMTPVIESAMENSIHKNKEKLATVIFPIIGPAIKKSIQEALSAMIQNMQIIVDRMTSLEGLKWRVQSITTGVPVSEIILRNVLIYRIEYIYLIHRKSAKVLRYVQATDAVEINKLVFSGMIEAVKNFAQDIFTSTDHIKLNRLDFNQFKIILSETPLVSLVVLARGIPPADVDQIFYNLVSDVHMSYKDALSLPDPEVHNFMDCEIVLKKGLIEQKKQLPQKSKSFIQFKYVILGLVAGTLIFMSIWKISNQYILKQNLQTAILEIKNLDHVLILSEKNTDPDSSFTSLSTEPLLIQTQISDILSKHQISADKIKFSFFQTPILAVNNYNEATENLKLSIAELELESVSQISISSVRLFAEINRNSLILNKNVVVYIEYVPGHKKMAEQALFGITSRLTVNQIYDYHFLRIRPMLKPQKDLSILVFKVDGGFQ